MDMQDGAETCLTVSRSDQASQVYVGRYHTSLFCLLGLVMYVVCNRGLTEK